MNDGNEELRSDHVHLLEAVRHISDASVVKLVFRLEQRNEHRIFAVLLLAIGIEFLEVRFVSFAIHRIVCLVLHLEHDGDDLVALFIKIAEDEIALGAFDHFVVFLEIGMWEGGGAQTVELDLAVLLEALAEHLRRELRFMS